MKQKEKELRKDMVIVYDYRYKDDIAFGRIYLQYAMTVGEQRYILDDGDIYTKQELMRDYKCKFLTVTEFYEFAKKEGREGVIKETWLECLILFEKEIGKFKPKWYIIKREAWEGFKRRGEKDGSVGDSKIIRAE